MNEHNNNSESDSELIRNKIFSSNIEQKFLYWYRRIFSIEEIEKSRILQWAFGAVLLNFYFTFNSWIDRFQSTVEGVSNNIYICWPYYQGCSDLYFLSKLPYGYSQTTLYMFFFGLILLAGYLMWKKDWVLAHILVTILFAWKFFVMFILSYAFNGNFEYYHIIFALILLFLPLKLFFLKLTFVLFYFLASTIKLHETWILGTYFSALKTGLPIFPDSMIPFFTNVVIFMQIIGAWFLLSSNKFLQRTVLLYFIIFHLYSGILVEYRYPATVLPFLLILFGPMYSVTKVPLNKKAIAGWILVVSLFVFQFLSIIIPGDERLTLEGNQYGLYMFESNHQCISYQNIVRKDGTEITYSKESKNARDRCAPYNKWFSLKQICEKYDDVERIEWQFDHSINGGPFYRIVDVEDVCSLEYKALGHNEWIKTPEEGAQIMGYPVKNDYY